MAEMAPAALMIPQMRTAIANLHSGIAAFGQMFRALKGEIPLTEEEQPRNEGPGDGYWSCLALIRGGQPTDGQIRAVLGSASPDGPEGNVFALNALRKLVVGQAELARQYGQPVGTVLTMTPEIEAGIRLIVGKLDAADAELAAEVVRRFHGSERIPPRACIVAARAALFKHFADLVRADVTGTPPNLDGIPMEARPMIQELASILFSLDSLFTTGLILDVATRDPVSGQEHALSPIDGEENRRTEHICLEGDDCDAVTISGQPEHVEQVLEALGLRRDGKDLVRIEEQVATEKPAEAKPEVDTLQFARFAGVDHQVVLRWIKLEGAPFLRGIRVPPDAREVYVVDAEEFIQWLHDRKLEIRRLVDDFKQNVERGERDARRYGDPLRNIESKFGRGAFSPRKPREAA